MEISIETLDNLSKAKKQVAIHQDFLNEVDRHPYNYAVLENGKLVYRFNYTSNSPSSSDLGSNKLDKLKFSSFRLEKIREFVLEQIKQQVEEDLEFAEKQFKQEILSNI